MVTTATTVTKSWLTEKDKKTHTKILVGIIFWSWESERVGIIVPHSFYIFVGFFFFKPFL